MTTNIHFLLLSNILLIYHANSAK